MDQRKAQLYLATFAILFSIIEVLCFATGKFLQTRHIFYQVPPETYEEFVAIRQNFDPELGWPSKSRLADTTKFDRSGSRLTPSFPNPKEHANCIALYGDSYTESVGNTNEDAWGNKLSQLLNCRVANFGVAAYGTDQAYLRYEKNVADTSKIVVLGHFVDGIKRNLMQSHGILSFKPQFILNADKTGLERLPVLVIKDEEEFERYKKNPAEFLKHDQLAPGREFGSEILSFPYSFSIARLFFNVDFQTRLRVFRIKGEYYRRYYAMEDQLLVTTLICQQFVDLAKERGQLPIVVILPHHHDFENYAANGVWGFEPLIAALEARGITVFNFADAIVKNHESETYREIYDDNENALHFNAKGDEILAKVFYDFLQEQNIAVGQQ